nr:TonB-dependent receptor [Hyphomonas sp. Mor2]
MANDLLKKKLFATTLLAGAAGGLWTGAAVAQEVVDEDVTVIEEVSDADEARQEKVVVTGSRIARNSFTSTSPVQVLDGETIADAGFLDLAEALRTSSVVQGAQLDQQFNASFVSDAGPGAQSIGLRGLDPERTLILINGRRYAPAGIEGAPSFPDVSLIPSSMVERNEILLDGASSVYGSDAVAGVVNIILKDEFTGLEIGGNINQSLEPGGESSRLNFIAGVENDSANFVISGEYFRQEEMSACSRDWMRTEARADNWPDFAGQQICGSVDITDEGMELGTGSQSQSFAAFPFGAILLGREGTTNPAAGIPNFELANLGGNFNGLYFNSVRRNENLQYTPSFQRAAIFATGKMDLDPIPGTEVFMEFSLSNRQSQFEGRPGVIDAAIQPNNPFIQTSGFLIGGAGPTSNFTMRPIDPTPNGVESELTQYRGLVGLRGDLGFLFDGLGDWDYELFGGYTRSQGYSSRGVILEENLIRSLNTVVDPATGAIVCAPTPNPNAPFSPGESLEPCIPFNPFFGGLYPVDGSEPEFEDPRLLDYLSGSRSSTTFVDEIIFGGYATGPIFQLPAGPVQGLIGVEWREDAIDTRSDDVTARGLGSGFFVDRPTSGNVDLAEVFGELVVPVMKDQPLVHNLEFELAGRLVEHEFYGQNSTYAAKLRYEPTDFLTIRGTYGTSFRAPNLRELFLAGQSSFAAVTDPCEVPTLATSDTDGDGTLDAYTPGPDNDGDGIGDLDGRNPDVISNCQLEGLDPFSLAIGINTGTVETFSAGNIGLDPEESTSYSYGFVVEQPFFDSFDLQFSATYWNIEIEGSVFEPSANFLVGECYTSQNFPNDPFCTRRLRDPNTGFLNEIDATPFNIAQENANGWDFNVLFNTDFTALGQEMSYSFNGQATKTEEISETIILPGAPAVLNDETGWIGNPEWRATVFQRLNIGDFDVFWQTRMIGDQIQEDDADIPNNCVTSAEDPNGTASFRVTDCFGVDDTFYHDVSVGYDGGDWEVRLGVQNLLDQDPPRVDEDAGGFSQDLRNVPVGVGYDRVGRQVFVAVSKRF